MSRFPACRAGQNERNTQPGGVMKFLLLIAIVAVILLVVLPRVRGGRRNRL